MKRCALLLPVLLALVPPAGAQDTPEKDFKEAIKTQNDKDLEKACRGLVQLGSVDGAKLILSSFSRPALRPDIYWILIRAAAAFQSTDPLQAVAKFVLENKSRVFARDLCMALHNNFTAAAEEAMCTILLGGSEELRTSALDHLMDIGKKSAVAATIELMRKEGNGLPAEVGKRCFRLLDVLVGKEYGENASNWIGWWDANKDKPWDEIRKGGKTPAAGEGGTTTLGNSRQSDADRLKTAKVLVVRAGSACKCKVNHDYDPGIDGVLNSMPFETQSITKDKFEKDPVVTDAWLKQFIGIVAICTNIREHCICPTCKPGGEAGRQFQ